MICFKLFQEGTSSLRRLWHYTHLSKAARIAEEDTFQLTFGGGPSADNLQKSKLRNFYLSTSSIPSGRYGRGGTNGEGGGGFYPKSSHVLIELNASKISDNYKIKPVNYWGKEFKNMDETEERIVSRNSSMPARKYIEAIHIYLPSFAEGEEGEREKSQAFAHVKQIDDSGVKYYIYADVRDFARADSNRAQDPDWPQTLSALDSSLASPRSWETRQEARIASITDWLSNPTRSNTQSEYMSMDFLQSFGADLHNARGTKSASSQAVLQKLSELIRKTDKSIKQLVQDAQDKSRKIKY